MVSRHGKGAATISRLPEARVSLSRERIVAAALDFVDAQGLNELTMRRLGKQLGVEAMSLYRYVSGREDLLEAMVDSLVGTLHLSPEETHVEDGWQAYLQRLAHSVRRMARDHPHAFPLVATRHPAAPWLRPPLRSLDVVEDFLQALRARGFSDSAAVRAYRAFSSFLLGHLLLEVSGMGATTSPVEEPLDEGGAAPGGQDSEVDLADFPAISALQPLLSQDRSDEEFEQSLENLLDRIERSFAQ